MLLKELEKIIKIVEKSEIAELEWEKNKERIRIRKDNGPAAPMNYYAAPLPAAAPQMREAVIHQPSAGAAPATAPAAAPAAKGKEVTSPFVGTFYSAPSPTAAKYVNVGSSVKKGDVLCIIEAMKIMNEIEAEFPGKVVAVLVKDGQPVQFGQPLFQLE
jgi:acetyl-CoA carboxylase biotin carboxyl carrier protein